MDGHRAEFAAPYDSRKEYLTEPRPTVAFQMVARDMSLPVDKVGKSVEVATQDGGKTRV
jgi:hypothetical protein